MANRTIFEEPFEIDLKSEQGRMPIEAFGFAPFAFQKKKEDNNKRTIFDEPLFINNRQ